MRAILMTMLLIVVVLVIYSNVTGGEKGTKKQLVQAGAHMQERIAGMSP
ncbi:hypothetical protein A8990_112109 [Paenibacillus taihuensis]|uniref:Uncharacterized protein n=1 Tax=Paenibacillus taihuensis TaxID=1156355 RepID=A0A3D9S8X4_9BACL|nr:hypothetical protein [Paenibacillus taihuensis]REE85380.1 hypothetical protein A8990_112109 [Paenibacillus taihuensis]